MFQVWASAQEETDAIPFAFFFPGEDEGFGEVTHKCQHPASQEWQANARERVVWPALPDRPGF